LLACLQDSLEYAAASAGLVGLRAWLAEAKGMAAHTIFKPTVRQAV
jgi:hypothetical protein